MNRCFKDMLSRIVLLLLVAVQIAASLPHHHHGESEAVCFDITHCFEECHDGGCSSHEHDCEGGCALRIDVAQFSSEDSYKSFLHLACLVNDNFAVVDILSQCVPCACGMCMAERRHEPVPTDIFASYLRQAIPPRAPSLV